MPTAVAGARLRCGPGADGFRLRWVTDWSTTASLLTAAGTLALAVATFASIRSANRSARISERAARTVADAIKAGEPLVLDLLYGDFEGGQRVITQFSLRQAGERWLAQAVRHFNVDQPDPR